VVEGLEHMHRRKSPQLKMLEYQIRVHTKVLHLPFGFGLLSYSYRTRNVVCEAIPFCEKAQRRIDFKSKKINGESTGLILKFWKYFS
jgi:hypothetical protein